MSTQDTAFAAQVADFLRQLRSGKCDAASAASFENLPVADVLDAVRRQYSVVFQERVIGRKTELGLARSRQFQMAIPENGRHTFVSVELLPILRNCLVLSLYDGALSGISVAKSIRLRPAPSDAEGMLVAMGSGYKLDKLPDGWVFKQCSRRATVLSEPFLRARGWKFDVLQPFSRTS